MRDEYEGRMWSAHHEGLTEAIDALTARIALGWHRLGSWDGSLTHLGTLLLSVALTALTVQVTAI